MSNVLLDQLQHLESTLLESPRLRLAATICAFDTFHASADDENYSIDYDADEDDILNCAMGNLRRNFPAVYGEVLHLQFNGGSEVEASHLVNKRLEELHLPDNDFDSLANGFIPIMAFGIDLGYGETYEQHPDLIPLVKKLDPAHPEDIEEDFQATPQLYETGYYLIKSLHDHVDHPLYKQLYEFMCWLFAASGNSKVDVTDEDHDQFQPLVWDTPQDIEFAQLINEEAETYIDSINECFRTHLADPGLVKELDKNIARIHRHIAKHGLRNQKDGIDKYCLRLKWSD